MMDLRAAGSDNCSINKGISVLGFRLIRSYLKSTTKKWERQDSNLRRKTSTDLQSVAFDHSATLPSSLSPYTKPLKEKPLGKEKNLEHFRSEIVGEVLYSTTSEFDEAVNTGRRRDMRPSSRPWKWRR
ncbi:unnamed protein product [Linum trigynum]|uniref:Uncharacterized protein n=1 Tax=Linum trigynum TaxID=586398 RepID=A0AAV2DW72_9ROSI